MNVLWSYIVAGVFCVVFAVGMWLLCLVLVRGWVAALEALAERAEAESWAALREAVADERGTSDGVEPPPFIPNR